MNLPLLNSGRIENATKRNADECSLLIPRQFSLSVYYTWGQSNSNFVDLDVVTSLYRHTIDVEVQMTPELTAPHRLLIVSLFWNNDWYSTALYKRNSLSMSTL